MGVMTIVSVVKTVPNTALELLEFKVSVLWATKCMLDIPVDIGP